MYYEEYEVGDVAHSREYPVTREEILEFAGKYDPQYFHVDEARAPDSIFGGLIASGWHTCAITMRLMVDTMGDDPATTGSPGVNELRWLLPVRPGDVLTARIEVIDKKPMRSQPGIGLVNKTICTYNQDNARVLTMTTVNMIRMKNPEKAIIVD